MNRSIKHFIFLAVIAFSIFTSTGVAKAAVEAHPAGSLLLWNGTVYKVTDDGSGLQSFDSAEKFNSHFYDFADIVPINAGDQAKPIVGTVAWGDGRLFNENGTIYQLANGTKHGFASAEIFLSYGFKFSQAIAGQLNIPQGPTISIAGQSHLAGTFVISDGAVWQITASGRRGISSPEVLFSWGRNFSNLVPANVEDIGEINEGLLSIRTGSLINDSGTVWVVEQNNKRSFPTAACFTNFGYNFSMLIIGSTQGYINTGATCGPEPSSKYTRTVVKTAQGDFSADIMSFNLGNGDIKFITATANNDDCTNNCPVKSLSSFVTEAGGFAGINGTYFCPAAYPECGGKVNSFYWKVYNSNLNKMMNASNGVKEEMPFIAFNNSQITYFSQYKTFMNSMFPITAGINHEPRLVENGTNVLNVAALDEKERTVKSNRGALGFKGQVIYAVIIHSATIPDLAAVMDSLDIDYAINLDGGGSSAMMYDSSYKVGPGRNIPNAIIFAKQ